MYAPPGSDSKSVKEHGGKGHSATESFCCMQNHAAQSDHEWFVMQDGRDINGVSYFISFSETLLSVPNSEGTI